VQSLLLGSPDFLWITRGTPFWGPDAAIKRFAVLYEGTWRLDPEPSSLKVIMIGDGRCASLRPDHVHNRSARPTATADEMNQVLVKRKAVENYRASCPYPRLRNNFGEVLICHRVARSLTTMLICFVLAAAI
jgi:hypothetical protein